MADGWIGVDLDGTLAVYDQWRGATHIGDPIPLMVERVRKWLADGRDVRIFTARVSSDGSFQRDHEAAAARDAIDTWAETHLWRAIPVTNVKDYEMWELWDDRAVQVEANTGRAIGTSTRGLS